MKPVRSLAMLALGLTGAGLSFGQAGLDRAGTAPWIGNLSYTASATASWVENISRTSFAPTRKNSDTYALTLGASGHRELAPSWLLEFGADADYLAVPAFSRTEHLVAGPRMALQHKFGLGPLAPVLQFNAAYTYKDARFAADRGWTAEGGARLAKRLLPDLKVAASIQWLDHYAETSTFDIQQRTVSVEASWDISERWRLSGSAGRLLGTIVANAAPTVWWNAVSGAFGPAVMGYYTYIPASTTNLYGPGWVSYNVEANVDLWSVSLDYALGDHTSLSLSASSAFVINRVGVRYPTDSWGLGLQHRF